MKSLLKIVQLPIGDVIPYARNPRHNQAIDAKVALSIPDKFLKNATSDDHYSLVSSWVGR